MIRKLNAIRRLFIIIMRIIIHYKNTFDNLIQLSLSDSIIIFNSIQLSVNLISIFILVCHSVNTRQKSEIQQQCRHHHQ